MRPTFSAALPQPLVRTFSGHEKVPRPEAIGIGTLRSGGNICTHGNRAYSCALLTFSHPDYTVGAGVTPDHALVHHVRLRAIPPVRT